MRPLTGLPVDLVNAILEAAYLTPSGRPDYATLGQCALVSRAWRVHAQRLYFRWLSVRTPECVAGLTARLFVEPETRHTRALKNAVRIVELGPAVELDFLLDALGAGRCAFVYELRLDTLADDVPTPVLDRLRACAGLRTLRLAAPGARVARQMADACTGLARLELSLARFEEDGAASGEWAPDGLRELRVAAEVVPPDARPALDALIAAAAPGLEALSLDAPDYCPALGAPVQLDCLRSLSIDRWTDDLAEALEELPLLAELQFWRSAVVRTSASLIASLPVRLVHLAVPAGDSFTGDRRKLEVDALPKLTTRLTRLRVVTVHSPGTVATLGWWARYLVAFCKAQGIEIDLIPCTGFPRYREAANYSYMAPPALLAPSQDDLAAPPAPHPDTLVPECPSPDSSSSSSSSGESSVTPTVDWIAHAPLPPDSVNVLVATQDAPPRLTDVEPAPRTFRSRWRKVMHKLKVILPHRVRVMRIL
ncbi:hypothetical protein AURDEDRAFT_160561 [Auricularia subglabra TFB-10046 SS5]|nr:hypothetical protein AURDEDRAFT_160561 [Auricularia subglabra TFB-10046 SS5]